MIQLPKTGQTTSYATGDDGALQKGVAWPNPRFTDNTNGTVTDNLTGLVWLKNANCFGAQGWTTALNSANTLANGACGLTDGSTAGQWHLPNINELKSLREISKDSPPLAAGHPFTSVQSVDYAYWSSSSDAGFTGYAWWIDMYSSGMGYGSKSYNSYVWPVRAGQELASTIALPATGQTACYNASASNIACAGTGQDGETQRGVAIPTPRFIDNGNGTVTDKITGLIWLKNADCFDYPTWAAALSIANTLATGACGLTDGSNAGQWRLPDINELDSLVDRSMANPALTVGHPFTSVKSNYGTYWSSSSSENGSHALGVSMNYGNVGSPEKIYGGYVWLVRSGQ